jgi:hypothetical protein
MIIDEMAIKTLLGTTGILVLLRFLIVLYGKRSLRVKRSPAMTSPTARPGVSVRRMAGIATAIIFTVPLL